MMWFYFKLYAISVIAALMVIVMLHKLRIWRLPSWMTAVLLAWVWPLLLVFFGSLYGFELLGPYASKLDIWWNEGDSLTEHNYDE